jgi:allophanate hydrolase subunit 2
MPVAAQLMPGDELRFEEITIEGALGLRKARGDALASLRR